MHRLLKEALVSGKHEELFGEARAREWPQARARATAEDDRLDSSWVVARVTWFVIHGSWFVVCHAFAH
jgi:hypothetical protein